MSNYNITKNTSLSHANTMALMCTAAEVVTFTTEVQIVDFLHSCNQKGKEQSLIVLSGGSNMLLPETLDACVLRPDLKGIHLIKETEDDVFVEVMAGEDWHQWVLTSIKNGWYGLENLALIPGLVGASPVQNIGAYGVELCDFFAGLTAINLKTAEQQNFTLEQCDFGYRDSFFKQNPNQWLITKVVFRLHKKPQLHLKYADIATLAEHKAEADGTALQPIHVAQAVIDIRQKKLPDPKQLANTGSFFKNPVMSYTDFLVLQQKHPTIPFYEQENQNIKIPAGWLIDHAGLKGACRGNIATHTHQALVVVNHAPNRTGSESSTQQDVLAFSEYIQSVILKKYNVTLEREPVWVNVDGTFQ